MGIFEQNCFRANKTGSEMNNIFAKTYGLKRNFQLSHSLENKKSTQFQFLTDLRLRPSKWISATSVDSKVPTFSKNIFHAFSLPMKKLHYHH